MRTAAESTRADRVAARSLPRRRQTRIAVCAAVVRFAVIRITDIRQEVRAVAPVRKEFSIDRFQVETRHGADGMAQGPGSDQ
jgi:hypothetical protein